MTRRATRMLAAMPEAVPSAATIAARLDEHFLGGVLTLLIEIGHVTQLFDGAAEGGPATSAELAVRVGCSERYVREWLYAMTAAGIFVRDADTDRYTLPPASADALSGSSPSNRAPRAALLSSYARQLDAVVDAFRRGGGVSTYTSRPRVAELLDRLRALRMDAMLVDHYLASAPEVTTRMRAGARVLDLGCRSGDTTLLLARMFPSSTLLGVDADVDAIARARAKAAAAPATNVTFEELDLGGRSTSPSFGVVLLLDALRSVPEPPGCLDWIVDQLDRDGVLFLAEPNVASTVDDNVDDPLAINLYGTNLLHTLTTTLAERGDLAESVFGHQQVVAAVRASGLHSVISRPVDEDPTTTVYVCSRG